MLNFGACLRAAAIKTVYTDYYLHKFNVTYICIWRIVVDLKHEHWYQKCHDPVCKADNFKSECEYFYRIYNITNTDFKYIATNTNSFICDIGSPLPAEVCLSFVFKEVCFLT